MDVLIILGSSAAFLYSCIGLWLHDPDFYFFETAASIVTLVLLVICWKIPSRNDNGIG